MPRLTPLLRFVRTLQPRGRTVVRITAKTVDGKTLEGDLLNQGFSDVQMRTADGRVHLLRREGDRFREAAPGTDWPGYNGDPGGNRYTTLSEITKANLSRLRPKWMFTLPGAGLSAGHAGRGGRHHVHAHRQRMLRAGRRHRPPDLALAQSGGERTGGTNRGVAIAGDRVFMQTDKAHIIALNRFTGELLWDTEMADSNRATSPLRRRWSPATW